MWEEVSLLNSQKNFEDWLKKGLYRAYKNMYRAGRGKTTFQDNFLSCRFFIHIFLGGSGTRGHFPEKDVEGCVLVFAIHHVNSA